MSFVLSRVDTRIGCSQHRNRERVVVAMAAAHGGEVCLSLTKPKSEGAAKRERAGQPAAALGVQAKVGFWLARSRYPGQNCGPR